MHRSCILRHQHRVLHITLTAKQLPLQAIDTSNSSLMALPKLRNTGCCQCDSCPFSHRTHDMFPSHLNYVPSGSTPYCIHRCSRPTLILALSIHTPILSCQRTQAFIGITLTVAIHLRCSFTGAAVCIPILGWKPFFVCHTGSNLPVLLH